MGKGRLNNVEKMAIQGGISQGQTAAEIAKELGRTTPTVQKYINEELEGILQHIAEATVQAEKDFVVDEEPAQEQPASRHSTPREGEIQTTRPEDTVKAESIASREIIQAVCAELRRGGLVEKDVNQIVTSALKAAANSGKTYKNQKVFYAACLKRMNAGHFIQKQTEGGSEGIAVMSGAASAHMDNAKKKQGPVVSRSARGAVFNPKTGEML